jgi:hypothetical protein
MNPSASRTPSTEMARHYGNMRFAMFTVFSAVSGGLLAFPFSAGGSAFLDGPGNASHRLFLGLAGLALSGFFVASEWRISYLVTLYQEAAFNDSDFPKPKGHRWWKRIILTTMLLPYALAGVFWLFYLSGSIVVPLVGA